MRVCMLMFCTNCGKATENPNGICDECAVASAPATPVASAAPAETPAVSESIEKPKNKSKLWLIIAISAVLLIGICVAVYFIFFSGPSFDTPQEHLAYVEKNVVTSGIDYLYNNAEYYGKSSNAEIHVKFSDRFIDEQFNLDSQDSQWLKDIYLKVDGNYAADDLYSTMIQLGLNNTTLLSIEQIMDLGNNKGFLKVPELSDSYINYLQEPGMTTRYNPAADLMNALSKEDAQALAPKYIQIIIDNLNDVTALETTVEANGVKQSCVELRASISEKDMLMIQKAILTEAKNDQVLLDAITIVSDKYSSLFFSFETEEETDTENDIIKAIDEELASIEKDLADAATAKTDSWIVYVDDDNEVIGRKIDFDDTELSYLMTVDVNRFGIEGELEDAFSFIGGGKVDISNFKIEGEIAFNDDSERRFLLKVQDCDYRDMKKGRIRGTFYLELENDGEDGVLPGLTGQDPTLKITCDTNGDFGNFIFDFIADGETAFTVTYDYKYVDSQPVSVPNEYFDYENVAAWILEWDIEGFSDNAEQAGIPTEYMDEIEDFLYQLQAEMQLYSLFG